MRGDGNEEIKIPKKDMKTLFKRQSFLEKIKAEQIEKSETKIQKHQ